MLLLLASPPGARAEGEPGPVESLVARARGLKLQEDLQWLRLGHWRPAYFGGWKSEADGNDFFLAKDGKTNPAAELEATLRALFGELPRTQDQIARKVQPPLCRFPARASYLFQKLGFGPSALPAQECPELDDFWRRVQPESATLIFSSYYMNNPASALGHTFLRIHKTGDGVSSERRELLDYGIDYSATADTGNAAVFAFKSLVGLYPGFFHIFPYYYKVREYNDYESRDLWEYDLQLTPQELAMVVAHTYELGWTYFNYFYVDENCSYHLLAVLEAAAPRLHLLEHLKIPVIPADTVKALYENEGLVSGMRYRPSAMTQFRTRIEGMDAEQRDTVESLSRDADTALPPATSPADQIRLFDAAADLIDVRYAKELPTEPNGKGGKLKQRVLERRASILVPSRELSVPLPKRKQPHTGHGSGRFSIESGYSSANGPLMTLAWRLTLHDLLDPPQGYPELAEIEFLPTRVRIYPREEAIELESFAVVSAVSLHPVSSFDQSLSWRFRTGARRLRDGGCNDCLAFNLEVGSGFTIATAGEAVTLFALGDAVLDAARGLRGIELANALRVGFGPQAGARLRLGEGAVLLLAGSWHYFPAALSTTSWMLESSLRFAAGPGIAVGLEARKFVLGGEAGAQVFFYF